MVIGCWLLDIGQCISSGCGVPFPLVLFFYARSYHCDIRFDSWSDIVGTTLDVMDSLPSKRILCMCKTHVALSYLNSRKSKMQIGTFKMDVSARKNMRSREGKRGESGG